MGIYNIVLLFSFVSIYYKVKSDSLQGGTFQNNQMMNSYVLLWIKNTGPKICVRNCLVYTGCNAVNYHKQNMTCQLLKVSYPDDHSKDQSESMFTEIDKWTLKGSPCWPNPCTGQKKCVVVKHHYPVCVNYATFCDNIPCKNGGLCRNEEDGYSCTCIDGYHGNKCLYSQCDSNPCDNQAVCKSKYGGYTCTCMPGYYGDHCQSSICDSNPCQHDAQCNISADGFFCTCVSGYFGSRCESSLCDAIPCVNGGQCSIQDGYFVCTCKNGYYGDQCQSSPCESFPCQYNGSCILTDVGYNCTCQTGYSGVHCESSLCDSMPCQNNGTCIVGNSRYTCKCVKGYEGDNCQTKIDKCVGRCGDFSPDRTCQCDTMCGSSRDCCEDFHELC